MTGLLLGELVGSAVRGELLGERVGSDVIGDELGGLVGLEVAWFGLSEGNPVDTNVVGYLIRYV